MPVSPSLLLELLRKAREGTISPREMALLQLYLSSPESDDVLEQLNFHSLPELADIPIHTPEERFRTIEAIVARKSRVHRMRRWMVAASLVFLVGSAVGWLLLGRSRDRRPQLAAAYSIFKSGDGELKQVRLPDGSEVALNARSVLVYDTNFGVKDRVVELQEGEAFFDVKPDPARPFVVRTKAGVQADVLGTSFDFKVYRSNPKTEIAIKTGKIRVSRQGHVLNPGLLAGDRLDFNPQQDDWSVSRIDANAIGEWRTGGVELQQADFGAMAEVMQEIYGIRIIADSAKVAGNRYSLRIHYHADPRLLVEAIAAINGNQLNWESNDVVHFH